MYCLQTLSSSIAVIFLGLCLQTLTTSEAADIQKLLEVNVIPMGPAKPGRKIELACSVQSYWTNCAPIPPNPLIKLSGWLEDTNIKLSIDGDFEELAHVNGQFQVKVSTMSNPPIDFPFGNLNYTYCACPGEAKTFYWTIQSSRTANIGCRAAFLLDDVCPKGQNLILPQNKGRYYGNMKTLKIIT